MSTKEVRGIGLPIASQALDALFLICQKSLPFEACGLLGQTVGSASIDCIVEIRNVHPAPKHAFAFDPEEWTNAYFSMQKNRQQLVGFFHSHPHTRALPSIKDLEGWLPQSGFHYWIVSMVNEGLPIVQPYCSEQGDLIPVPLVLA